MLILLEGYFREKTNDTYEFKADEKGPHKIVAWREIKASNVSMEALYAIIHSKKELKSIPVIPGADFGHTMPLFAFSIGGMIKIEASEFQPQLCALWIM